MRIRKKDDGTKYFTTSDLHFYHKNVIRYSNRPFDDVDEMNDTLILNWNSVVGPNDIVFNLGDFAFASENKTVDLFYQLNGKQYFIFGNHDNQIRKCKRQKKLIDDGKVLGFYDYLEFKYDEHLICMSHYSMRTWNQQHRGALMLYGHSHGSLPGLGRSMDVGVDTKELVSDYTPFSMDTIVEFLKYKNIHKVDHH